MILFFVSPEHDFADTKKPYAVTKAAQIHLAKSLAVIAAPRIRVNSVAPGVLLTVKLPLQPTKCVVADADSGMGSFVPTG